MDARDSRLEALSQLRPAKVFTEIHAPSDTTRLSKNLDAYPGLDKYMLCTYAILYTEQCTHFT